MEDIKVLREETGLSFAQIKKALDEVGGDVTAARAKLQEYSAAQAEKKGDRELGAGYIGSYIHNGQMGAMVVLSCETDFVSGNPEYQAIARDIAMHICAMGSEDSNMENIDAILGESFIKDSEKTVGDIVNGAIQKFGENVKITKISRVTL